MVENSLAAGEAFPFLAIAVVAKVRLKIANSKIDVFIFFFLIALAVVFDTVLLIVGLITPSSNKNDLSRNYLARSIPDLKCILFD